MNDIKINVNAGGTICICGLEIMFAALVYYLGEKNLLPSINFNPSSKDFRIDFEKNEQKLIK